MSFFRLARMPLSRAMSRQTLACSSRRARISNPVRRRRRKSKMACACTSEKEKRSMRLARASLSFFARRMMRIISSRWSTATIRAVQHMQAGFGLVQLIARAAGDDGFLVADKALDDAAQAHLLGLSVGNGHHVDAEGDLQIRILIQRGQNGLGIHVAPELDNRAHARAVAFVADIINTAQRGLFFFAELQDFFQHGRLGDLIGHLRDDQQLAPRGAVLDMHPGPQRQLAPSGFIGGQDFRRVQQHAARWGSPGRGDGA